jgi:Peptidase family M28
VSWLAREAAARHAEVDIDEAMRVLARLTTFDRYQGSAGIAAAAQFVAEQAERAGLAEVEVLRLPADGRSAWWTFTAPSAWTPVAAELAAETRPGGASAPVVRYPQHPYALAANSASTDGKARVLPLVVATESAWPPEALVLVESGAALGPDLFARLRAERATGFAVVTHPDRLGQAGRVELPAHSGLFAFSLTSEQHEVLRRAARAGHRAVVTVDADTAPADMPVVTARTVTGGPQECLLTAHLCHPAPGANDNASGVSGALAVARVLAHRPLRRAVRFVWGPEFVGLAAYLHTVVGGGAAPRPLLGINLDMIGEDQRLCGGPLILERSPEYLPHFLNALAEAAVRALPQSARSYSSAVGCDVWAWRATAFVGASDHSILADRSIGCPAVQLGHWPDRFNHSSADTLDKVDPQELRRAAAVAATVLSVACEADVDRAADLARLVARWTAHRMLGPLPGAEDLVSVPAGGEGWISPASETYRAARLDDAYQFGSGALDSLRDLGAQDEVLKTEQEWLSGLRRHLAADSGPGDVRPIATQPTAVPLARRWAGPFNLRALMGACLPEDRRWLEHEVVADRGRFYAIAMALAQGIDGQADPEQIVRRAALDSGLLVERRFGLRFLSAMTAAGWAGETGTGRVAAEGGT